MTRSFDPELWRQADQVLDRLLDLPAEERAPHLSKMELPDDVRERVRRLLLNLDRAGPLDSGGLLLTGALAQQDADALEGLEIGPWRLEERIGRGGMSTVWRARRTDDAFDAAAAIKLLNSALLATDWQQRFRREAGYLAQLRHPGIATLLDAGVSEDGTPYLVTELIDGKPIHDHCCDAGLDIRARVALMRQLCAAVAFAQKRLFVHRDIKPENVLVTADGQVKLLDFGIAKPLAGESDAQATVTMVFTPDYAAPEQLTGDAVTTATDVYSLGALLYRLLAGEAPFSQGRRRQAGSTPLSPSRRVATRDDLTPGERRSNVHQLRGDLDNIVRKAMEESPESRYPDAAALERDLTAWLEHRPVSARAPTPAYQMRLFARRRPALAGALVALLLVGGTGLAATLWQAREAARQAELARGVTDYLVTVFTASDPRQVEVDDPPASQLLSRGSREALATLDDPAVAAELLRVIGSMQRQLGFFDDAGESLTAALATVPAQRRSATTRAQTLMDLGLLAHDIGQYEESVDYFRRGLDALPRREAAARANGEVVLAQLLVWTDPGEALDYLPAVRRVAADPQTDPELRLKAMRTQMMVLDSNGRPDELESIMHDALAVAAAHPDVSPLLVSEIHSEMGMSLLGRGSYDEAGDHLRRVIEIESNHYGVDHPRLAVVWANIGSSDYYGGRAAEAVLAFNRAIAIGEAAWAEDHPTLDALRALRVGSLWSSAAWQDFDRETAALANAPLSAGTRLWVDMHDLLALHDRGRWHDAAARGDGLLEHAAADGSSPANLDALRALTAWSWINAGDPTRGAAYLRSVELPTSGGFGWADQLLGLTMIRSLQATGQTDVAERWRQLLEQHGPVMPVLLPLAVAER